MNRMARQSESSKYCLECRYCLDHLESDACPECGHGFDPKDTSTFSQGDERPIWPRWETCLACVLLALLYFQTWEWNTSGPGRWRHMTISWAYSFAPTKIAFDYLIWFSPVVLTIPVFLASGIRAKPRSRVTILLTFICLGLYLICDGVWIWLDWMPSILKEIYEHESYFEALSNIFDD